MVKFVVEFGPGPIRTNQGWWRVCEGGLMRKMVCLERWRMVVLVESEKDGRLKVNGSEVLELKIAMKNKRNECE